MRITDVPCNCACGWSGKGGDCELDMTRHNPICCPVCLTPVTCDDGQPSVFTITRIEFARDFNEIFDNQPPPTVTITFQAPLRFKGEKLLVGKHVEIRVLEDFDDPC